MYIIDKAIYLLLIIYTISFIVFWILCFSAIISGELKKVEDALALFKNKTIRGITLTTIFSGMSGFGAEVLFTQMLINNFKEALKGFDNKSDEIFINGKRVENPQSIINHLVSYHPIKDNDSSPTKKLILKAYINNNEINYAIARDNKDSTIYWIYSLDYTFLSTNPSWKIKTDLFNRYK